MCRLPYKAFRIELWVWLQPKGTAAAKAIEEINSLPCILLQSSKRRGVIPDIAFLSNCPHHPFERAQGGRLPISHSIKQKR